MKTTFTPGPWETDFNTVVSDYVPRYVEIKSGVKHIANASYGETDAVRAANAAIISAAPELLTALISAIESSGFTVSGPTDSRAAENSEPAWICSARAAIAKATTYEWGGE